MFHLIKCQNIIKNHKIKGIPSIWCSHCHVIIGMKFVFRFLFSLLFWLCCRYPHSPSPKQCILLHTISSFFPLLFSSSRHTLHLLQICHQSTYYGRNGVFYSFSAWSIEFSNYFPNTMHVFTFYRAYFVVGWFDHTHMFVCFAFPLLQRQQSTCMHAKMPNVIKVIKKKIKQKRSSQRPKLSFSERKYKKRTKKTYHKNSCKCLHFHRNLPERKCTTKKNANNRILECELNFFFLHGTRVCNFVLCNCVCIWAHTATTLTTNNKFSIHDRNKERKREKKISYVCAWQYGIKRSNVYTNFISILNVFVSFKNYKVFLLLRSGRFSAVHNS